MLLWGKQCPRQRARQAPLWWPLIPSTEASAFGGVENFRTRTNRSWNNSYSQGRPPRSRHVLIKKYEHICWVLFSDTIEGAPVGVYGTVQSRSWGISKVKAFMSHIIRTKAQQWNKLRWVCPHFSRPYLLRTPRGESPKVRCGQLVHGTFIAILLQSLWSFTWTKFELEVAHSPFPGGLHDFERCHLSSSSTRMARRLISHSV